MNSFSPNKSVSNSKTVVRFAVDLFSMAGLLSFTSIILLAPLANGDNRAAGAPAVAYAPPESDADVFNRLSNTRRTACVNADSQECKDAIEVLELQRRKMQGSSANYLERSCADYRKKIEDADRAARTACVGANLGGGNGFDRCFDQLKWCEDAQTQLSQLIDSGELSEQSLCSPKLADQCPGIAELTDGASREEEKEAERERLEAKRSVDELARERRDAQRDMLKQQRELQEAQQDAAYEVRKAEREIAKDMSSQFKEVQEGQKKAFEDAQRAYQEMDATYIKMRDESRQYALKVEEAKDKFHGQCIAQAESQFKAAEQARMAAKAKKKKNSGTATRLAGSRNRQNLNQTAKRNFDYNAYLNECLNGQTGVGKSLANAVRAAEREKATRDQSLKEQAALIEQQRQTMMKKLMELESVAEGQNAEIVKLTNERLQNLSEEQQRISIKNQARLREFMQDQQLRLNDIDQRMATESQQLTRFEQRAQLASRQVACGGRAGRRSESRTEKLSEAWGKAGPEIAALSGWCESYEKTCNPEKRTTSSSGSVSVTTDSATPSRESASAAEPRHPWPHACVLATQAAMNYKSRSTGGKRPRWSPDEAESVR